MTADKTKQNKICPYCRDTEFSYSFNDTGESNLALNHVKDAQAFNLDDDCTDEAIGIVNYEGHDGWLIDCDTGDWRITIPIKYCPECGRKLC